ncbi:CRISPR-associated endonuclease Cas2 [Candidatus Vampirococcus lugosii]|uniref:CRISPR-associated endoribonuclease Cas2 n=1 Tax=Candidatus Vampirococcus lugosii TaxID=2789015 RepID=A0ABS5QKF7_9BACT|nr:CRISPR-associated endonuclease Cas2 [Candidatus Vampirococcus lugosii]MBS8121723.1 CRISPR/Cas system-associated endoribonuclease Cas2 [Candidatus Vampirococcus lugosii]
MRVLRLSNEKMYLSISYDISNTKARNRIVKLLESYGFRVQKSVFEVQLNERQFKILKKQLQKILDRAKKQYPEEHNNVDSIKFYVLSKIGEGSLDGRIDGLGSGYEKIYFEEFMII